jgi:hypothetical protein
VKQELFRVVRISNYDHEDWRGNQWFVTVPLTSGWAESITKALNAAEHDHSDNYFRVVPDSYVLPPDWEP